MQRSLFPLVMALLFAIVPAISQDNKTPTIAPLNEKDQQLPELRKIKRVTLSPNYGCRSKEDFRKGYANTALFLTEESRELNRPNLLFNGACNSQDTFDVQTAGDDIDVITDYGDLPLAKLMGQHVFSPARRVDQPALFAQRRNVILGHTYGVLINKSDVRGFFYFKVVAYVPNQKVDLEYEVMDYQVLRVAARSPGFTWDLAGTYQERGSH